MAKLEVQIGADNSEFQKKIAEVERDIQELSKIKLDQIKLGLDTKEIDGQIKDAKKSLSDLKSALKDTGASFSGATPKVANAGNALQQFSRIAQDAPFGIMGIGNNITATAEAFAALSKDAGGAGGALKAVGASLAGPGGILLAVSLVTTALTVMSQKGITVGDVFDKLTGNFDNFKKELNDVNAEAAKNSAAQIASVNAYVSAAKDINLSMQDRLIAVKKLQDEYPAFFGNLTKEQILNGNVANAVKDVIAALKAKALAQAYAGKLGDLAANEVTLREKEAKLIKMHNDELTKRNELQNKLTSSQFNELIYKAWQQADRALKIYTDDLNEVQNAIRANSSEMDKWAAKSTVQVKASIKLEYEPPKLKKVKELHPEQDLLNMLKPAGLDSIKPIKVDILGDMLKGKDEDIAKFIDRLRSAYTPISKAILEFNKGISDLVKSSFPKIFEDLGSAIGQALASGTNVMQAVGASLISSMGSIISAIGDKLIALGSASLLASTVFSTFGTALGVGAALAAIAGGVALKTGGGFLSSKAQQMSGTNGSSGGSKNYSAGGSVISPQMSYGGGYSGGYQNVVFEISGQSLVGVLSNTLNKNVKLGGVPVI